jgi:uncharacterized membrane protein YbhN (UPF0104 family)
MKQWIHYAVLAFVLIALVALVDLRAIAHAILSIPPASLAIAFGIATLDRFVMGYKWRQLILAAGANIRLGTAVSAYYQSGISSRLLPIPMASDLLRAHIAHRAGLPVEQAFSSIAIEKLTAWIACTILAIAGLSYLFVHAPGGFDMLGPAFATVIALEFAVMLLFFYRPAHRFTEIVTQKYLPTKLYHLIEKFSKSLLAYRDRPKALFVNLILATGEQLLQATKFIVLALALGVEMPLSRFLAGIVLMLTARRILGYFESWGLAETGTVVMLTLLGIDETTAVALIFLNFAVTTFAAFPGIYLIYRNGIGLKPAAPRN